MTTHDGGDPRARAIIRGLGGQHLIGFLPGQDNKAAISKAVGGGAGWASRGVLGHVTRRGVGEWPASVARQQGEPGNALAFLTWGEVLDVVARGCAGGHREAYEAAYAAWCEEVKAGGGQYPRAAFCDRLHEAEHALIRNGCRSHQATVQDTLFPDLTATGR